MPVSSELKDEKEVKLSVEPCPRKLSLSSLLHIDDALSLLVLTGAYIVTKPGQNAEDNLLRTSWLSLKDTADNSALPSLSLADVDDSLLSDLDL